MNAPSGREKYLNKSLPITDTISIGKKGKFDYESEVNRMKATGIVRRIDDLGRVVIPKEIRRTMRIREGDPLEIFTDREGEVILKKYSPISELSQFAGEYADCANTVLGDLVLISDTDHIIAVSGGPKKDFIEKRIGKDLEKVIQDKATRVVLERGALCAVTADEGMSADFASQILVPIVSQGDAIGSIVILSKDDPLGETELKAAEIGATFLAKQMES
jgi:AbrB family transcriptional regulator (stage V sporulation protein T)